MSDDDNHALFQKRLPTSSITSEDFRSGLIVLPIIGVLYMYGAIYILNKKYFYPSVAHIISLVDQSYTAIVYCSLNMMIYLFIMLYSTLLAQDNLGISTVLGSEVFNLLFVMGWVQLRASAAAELDFWIFIKESMFYLGTLVFATIYFSFNAINWWQALVWLIYFFIYAIYFQKKNERLRDKIALFFGLKDEDDVFSSDENFGMKRRRYSLTDITTLINPDDPELVRKIRRNEGALKIQLKDHSKFEMFARFQKVVHMLAFGIHHKIEEEKKLRSQLFREKAERLYPSRSTRKQFKTKDENQNEDDINEDKRDEEEKLIHKEANGSYPFEANNDDISPNKTPNPTSQVDVMSRGPGMIEDNMEPGIDDLANVSNNMDEMYVFEDDNMSIPRSAGKKIMYFLFLPVNFLYFVVLFYFRKQPNIRTAGLSMVAILSLQAILVFLLVWWTEIIIDVLDIYSEVAGVSFTAVGFSISFIVYNLKFQSSEKDANFFTTFQMVGIYKFGFAGAVGWLLSCATEGITAYPNIIQGLQVSALIYLGLFILSSGWIGINKAKIPKIMALPYIVSYIGFLVASVLVLIYYRSETFCETYLLVT